MVQPTLRENLLGWLVNPNIALLLLVGGALLIYLEFNTPGTIVPGALGTLMVLLAIFALNLLPIRYTAVLLLMAAFVLMLLEAKFGGHGVARHCRHCLPDLWNADAGRRADSGAARSALGGDRGEPGIRRHHGLPGAACRARAAHESHGLGADALVGSAASAMEPLAPEGHVLVEGEIWQAVASEPVPAGARLRVVGHEQYLLQGRPGSSSRHSRSTAA